ncbi:class I SAM-dependent methyltransferase [Kiritimatiella glycovorans]|uniref:Putative methyltransferase n=1 Tax=Kiritimatiella glycovorans TaxID=1307763 RepID=A0A0G3EF07_9BACT|nr:class I SAM-dependent methyltransferase [Kiritimatiella glycovorans]AKJ65036.1 putative methyltransferase [Kiritimatiella glycovorans]
MDADFYRQKFCDESEYAKGTYRLDALFRGRAMRNWLRVRGDSPIRIMDAGCGRGVFLRDLVAELERRELAVETVCGTDVVPVDADFAYRGKPFTFHVCDLNKDPVPAPDRSFDLVFCNHVIEHVFHTEHLVRELYRIAADEALVVISTPNLTSWLNRIMMLCGGQPLGPEVGDESITYGLRPGFLKKKVAPFVPAGHIRAFSPPALKDLCESAGFSVRGWWNQGRGPAEFKGARTFGILLGRAGAKP